MNRAMVTATTSVKNPDMCLMENKILMSQKQLVVIFLSLENVFNNNIDITIMTDIQNNIFRSLFRYCFHRYLGDLLTKR